MVYVDKLLKVLLTGGASAGIFYAMLNNRKFNNAVLTGGAGAGIVFTVFYLIDKVEKHDNEFISHDLRLEELESSHDPELKK